MLRLAFDFIITWRETRTRPNAYVFPVPGGPLTTKISAHSGVVYIASVSR